jgi:hypothetical protein
VKVNGGIYYMKSSINYVKIKREKEGKCNICGVFDVLTWDHTPPKKAIFFSDVEIASIFSKHSEEKYPREYSQNGTKFRTICAKCNNNLGTYYDVNFVEFIHEVSQKVYTSFPNEDYITCKIKPVKVIKSLFGHLLAAKGDYEDSLIDIEMRKFLLDDNLWLPTFNIFYWFHPYPNIEVMRDLAICKIGSDMDPDIFSMLKMYPISFYITKENTFTHLKNLKDYCSSNIDEYFDIPVNISTKGLTVSDWPTLVDDNTLLLAGQSINSSVVSIPRALKSRYLRR